MVQSDRHAYLDIDVDDVTPIVCSISADPTGSMLRRLYMRGNVHVYAGDFYHLQNDAVEGKRASIQLFTKDVLPPSNLFSTIDGVERSIGSVTIEADFAPVQHIDGEGGTYEAPPVEGWVAVTAAQFDNLLSTLATNRASSFAPRVRLRLAGNRLPGNFNTFVDIRDLVILEKRSYPVVGFELSAFYT